MFKQVWDNSKARCELDRLMVPGLLGFYEQCEVTHVFTVSQDRKTVSNVLTVVALEEHSNDQPQEFRFLNGSTPIEVKSFKKMTFGVARYRKPIRDLLPAIDNLIQTRQWTLSGTGPLLFGQVSSAGCQFVPPNAITNIPWNLVLKNNFWNGSYVFEWADSSKTHLDELFEAPKRIQDLSEAIQKWVPLRLASLSDRLGNLVVQLPVRILINHFSQPRQSGDLVANVVWHPRATPRALKVTCRFDFDSSVEGFAAASVSTNSTVLPAQAERGTFVATIWDEENQAILASTDTSSFIESIPISIDVLDPEPRVLTITRNGKKDYRRLTVYQRTTTVVGRQPGDDWNGGRTYKRMYQEEVAKLKEQRRFVHYNPRLRDRTAEHKNALDDIRALINTYGEHGAWLWDRLDQAETIVWKKP